MEIHEILVEKGELYLLSLLFTVCCKHGQEPEKNSRTQQRHLTFSVLFMLRALDFVLAVTYSLV